MIMNTPNGWDESLLVILEETEVSEKVKKQAIKNCLARWEFQRKSQKQKTYKDWLVDQLKSEIKTLQANQKKTNRRTALVSSLVLGTLVAGGFMMTRKSNNSSSSTPASSSLVEKWIKEWHSSFAPEAATDETIFTRFPDKPFKISDLPWNTLDEKIKNIINDFAQKWDKTMQRIKTFMETGAWEVKFLFEKEAVELIKKNQRTVPDGILTYAEAATVLIETSQRKDGGTNNLWIISLSQSAFNEKHGIHRLTGAITNEMVWLLINWKNNTPHPQGRIEIVEDKLSIPSWVHEVSGMYVLGECISHVTEMIVEERVAKNDPSFTPSEDEILKIIYDSLAEGKFYPSDPKNYARVYFGIGLKNAWFPEVLFYEKSLEKILEEEYQRWIAFATNPANKATICQVLKFLEVVK